MKYCSSRTSQNTPTIQPDNVPLCVCRHRRPGSTETEDQECIINFDNESKDMDTMALRHVVLRQTLMALLEEDQSPPETTEADSGIDQHSGTDRHSGSENNGGSVSSSEEHQPPSESSSSSTQREGGGGGGESSVSGAGGDDGGEPATESRRGGSSGNSSSASPVLATAKAPPASTPDPARVGGSADSSSTARKPLESSSDGAKAGRRVGSKVPEKGVSSRDTVGGGASVGGSNSKQDEKNTPASTSQRKSPGIALPSSPQSKVAVHASEAESEERNDPRLEDPAPDYQKRVSFSQVLDVKEGSAKSKTNKGAVDGKAAEQGPSGAASSSSEPQHDYLDATSKLLRTMTAKGAEAFVNPVFQDEAVVDGWATDYGNEDQPTHLMSTAL